MTVITDTSPLNYLVLIDVVHILPTLFGKVTIPDAVLRELSTAGAPPEVRAWISWPQPGLIDLPSCIGQTSLPAS